MGIFNKAINQIESSFLRGEKKYLYGAGAIAGTAAAGATYGLTDKDSGIKAGVAGAIGVVAGYFGAKYGINKSLDRMADLDIGFIMTGKSLGGIMNSKMGGKIDGDTFNKVANEARHVFLSESGAKGGPSKRFTIKEIDEFTQDIPEQADGEMYHFLSGKAQTKRRNLNSLLSKPTRLRIKDEIIPGSAEFSSRKRLMDHIVIGDYNAEYGDPSREFIHNTHEL